MKELKDILKAVESFKGNGLCLATVVHTRDSSYRRPGARMLIFPEGNTVGSISGGCLERDVIERAKSVRESKESVLLTYDTSSDEDIHFGVGLGCNGVVEILVESLNELSSARRGLKFAESLLKARSAGVITTVFRCNGEAHLKLGERMFLDEESNIYGKLENKLLSEQILEDAAVALQSRRSSVNLYKIEGDTIEVFHEVIQASPQLIVFGAGYDAQPLVQMAAGIGFDVSVVDGRAAYATRERFPLADQVAVCRPETICEQFHLDNRTIAVIMSHNYLMDQLWLKHLLPQNLFYLGLMGPKKRAKKMLAELSDEDVAVNSSCFEKLHNPVGLDIGAETPEQIALAILAEIQAKLSGHRGGRLCEKTSAIHARPDELSAIAFLCDT